ncbi:TPA_asm: FtsK [Hydra adintovirus]|nr:TPA_asm: FtsK [Hydra adintovirus]
MDIIDLSWNANKSRRNNSWLLPRSIRGLIVGKSGCGKTTLLLNLLLRPGWLDYNNLQVFGKSLFQPEYKILKSCFEKKIPKNVILNIFELQDEIVKNACTELIIEEISKNLKERTDIICKFFEAADDVPEPEKLNTINNNLMIFDDLQLTKQNKCEKYYIRGRHSNVDCFYLAQNYFELPRRTIRENANFICLFKQDSKNVNHIYNDHVSNDMKLDEFKKFCNEAWSKKHGFVVIDLSSDLLNGKYRSGLDLFYYPTSLWKQ